MLRDWWQRWKKGRAPDTGPLGELAALARGAQHPLSPALSQWLLQRGWDGEAITSSSANEWATLAANEQAAHRRVTNLSGRRGPSQRFAVSSDTRIGRSMFRGTSRVTG
eukprot:8482942-Alexandrium_andersonii.AAC.1